MEVLSDLLGLLLFCFVTFGLICLIPVLFYTFIWTIAPEEFPDSDDFNEAYFLLAPYATITLSLLVGTRYSVGDALVVLVLGACLIGFIYWRTRNYRSTSTPEDRTIFNSIKRENTK